MRRPRRMLFQVMPFLLLLSFATVNAGRPVNPAPPITAEEAAGIWVGMDEVYQGLYRLSLAPDGSGLLAYTPPRSDEAHTDLYRLSDWDQDRDKVKFQATPLSDGSSEVKINGKVRRRSIRLDVQQKGGEEHRVQMIREEEFDAAVSRVREAMDRAD